MITVESGTTEVLFMLGNLTMTPGRFRPGLDGKVGVRDGEGRHEGRRGGN